MSRVVSSVTSPLTVLRSRLSRTSGMYVWPIAGVLEGEVSFCKLRIRATVDAGSTMFGLLGVCVVI